MKKCGGVTVYIRHNGAERKIKLSISFLVLLFWVKQKNKRGTKEKGKKACHACVLRKKSRQYLANRRRDRRRKPKSRPRDLSLGRLYRSACRRAAVAAAR